MKVAFFDGVSKRDLNLFEESFNFFLRRYIGLGNNQ